MTHKSFWRFLGAIFVLCLVGLPMWSASAAPRNVDVDKAVTQGVNADASINTRASINSADNYSSILLMLSSVFFVAMVAGGHNSNNRIIQIIAGVIVAIIAVALLISIGGSLFNRARTAPTSTVVAAAVKPSQIATRAPVTAPPVATDTPPPTLPNAPTLTPLPTRTVPPTVTPIPSVTPIPKPFEPVGDKSLYVPKLGLPGAVPIIELPLKNKTWDVTMLGHSVGHLEQTSWVGRTGNVVLVAHIQLNFQDMGPFLNLNKLVKGDQVMVADQGKFYVYQVSDIRTVDPTAVEVTYPTVDPIVTLITCTVWDANRGMFAKRLVVTARLIQAPQV